MQTSIKTIIHIACSFLLLVLSEHPSFSEMSISERALSGDMVVEELYQAGTGLPVGKIQSVRGKAIIFHRDPAVGYRAKTGLPLYQGDTLRTLAEAWILYRLVDGSKIVLAPETTLLIIRSTYNSTKKISSSFLSLKQGGARIRVRGREFRGLGPSVRRKDQRPVLKLHRRCAGLEAGLKEDRVAQRPGQAIVVTPDPVPPLLNEGVRARVAEGHAGPLALAAGDYLGLGQGPHNQPRQNRTEDTVDTAQYKNWKRL